MIGHEFKRIGGAALFLISLHSCFSAEDIVTKSGKVLRNAEIVSIEGGQITIQHAGGTEKLGATEIPEATQRSFRDLELKRKADEIERLKQELARREQELRLLKQDGEKLRLDTEKREAKEAEQQTRRDAELRTLKEENERLARELKPATSPIPKPATATPSKPIEQLPELKASDVFDARDLVLYYQNDAAGADRHFRKESFQIKGVVDKFEPKMFVRLYDVLLESPEKSVGVVCKFSYADRWNTVYTKDRGRVLVAKDGRSEIRLLKVGESVTIRARCEGLKGSDVVFSRCELVR